jgi:hypothetical protein
MIKAAFIILLLGSAALACPLCRAQVNAGIYEENLVSRAAVLFVPLFIIAAVGVGLFYGGKLNLSLSRLRINGKK